MIAKNNVFNIRYNRANKWQGQLGHYKGFVEFDSVRSAVRAAAILVFRTYYQLGYRTVRDILYHYAPPTENDTVLYIRYVCNGCGISADDIPCTDSVRVNMLYYMARFESGKILNKDLIQDVLLNGNLMLDNV